MDEFKNVVILDAGECERMMGTTAEYDLLLNALLESAELNYNKKALSFSDTFVANILKAAAPNAYAARLNKLQAEAMEEA